MGSEMCIRDSRFVDAQLIGALYAVAIVVRIVGKDLVKQRDEHCQRENQPVPMLAVLAKFPACDEAAGNHAAYRKRQRSQPCGLQPGIFFRIIFCQKFLLLKCFAVSFIQNLPASFDMVFQAVALQEIKNRNIK